MNHDRGHTQTTTATTAAADLDTAPGRATRTDRLNGPTGLLASGLLSRKARDANGVADGAEQAVGAASSSSGTALPDTLMRKFEGSLGTDLSSVRVHTGASSQDAASAVGAKAYTMGNDIHFGAGQFDTSSTAGQHLIAHEVAHTVQQRGGSPTRQNKLEVSSPGDHLEVEADRVADAMIAARPAMVAGGSGVARQAIMRDKDDDLPDVSADQGKAADAAEAKTKTDTNFVVQGLMTNANDSAAATKLLEEITLQQPNVVKGESSGLSAWKGTSSANVAVMGVLEQLLVSSGVENTAVSQFGQQYQRVQVDFNRLDASMKAFQAGNPGSGAAMAKANGDPEKMAAAVKQGAMLTSFDDKNMKKDIGEGGPAFALWKDARDKKNQVTDTTTEMQKWQGDSIANMHSVASVQGEINAGVRAATAPDDDTKAALAAVKAKCEEAKGAWDKVSKLVGKGVSAIVPEGGKDVADKALEQVPALISAYFAQAIAAAQLANDNSAKINDLKAIGAKGQALQGMQTTFATSVAQYIAAARKLDRTKAEYRAAMDKLGAKLDTDGKTGNHAYAQIAKLTAEGQNFITGAEAVIAMGQTEVTERGHVGTQKEKLVNKDGKAMPWYSVRAQSDLEKAAGVNGSGPGILVRNQVQVSDTQGSNTTKVDGVPLPGGSASGAEGSNAMIDKQVAQLKALITNAKGMVDGLQKILGF
jgi:hypothetical protein